ncbi:MAG: ABC transporter permease subunit, partial [Clostridia bacterium]|nr:ABC transporter permease subunit [Clostridia bacterium]
LMNIPEDLYESARIDGAGPVKAFFKITMPYMLHVTAPYLITQFIGNLNNFNLIFLLTGGDPSMPTGLAPTAGQTDLLITWLYKLIFNNSQYNIASVISILMFIFTAVVSLIVYNRSSAVKNEEDFM